MSNSRIIIGIIGEKGSGKTTAAECILKNNPDFKEVAFATPLKKMAEILKFPFINVYGTQQDKANIIPEYKTSFRQFAQCTSDSIKKLMGEDIFVKIAEQELDKNNVVFSDVRYLNEASMIKKHRGYLIKIERNIKKDKYSNHSSELELHEIKPDITIKNNVKLDEFKHIVSQVIKIQKAHHRIL
jgi:ABC-type oligopeptide transport system ATPase subunit